MVKECHRRKIRVTAHFNAGLDHENALLHREWCKLTKKGEVSLALRADDRRIRTVYLAPSRANLDFIEEDGYIRVTVPEVIGYQLVVFES